jgi:hypothetical protein
LVVLAVLAVFVALAVFFAVDFVAVDPAVSFVFVFRARARGRFVGAGSLEATILARLVRNFLTVLSSN